MTRTVSVGMWFTVFALLAAGVFADTLVLTNGRQYEGELVVKGDLYTIVNDGKMYQFGRHEIREVNGEAVVPAAGEKNPVMKITTSVGDLTVELFEDRAPNTVANMIVLAEKGFYKDLAFHRVIPGFMAQGGCPNSREGSTGRPGTGDPGYRFADEFSASLVHDGRGVLSMANSGPNTNGSQFFICFAPTPHLDGRHAVFGKVVDGLDVLDKIEAVGTPGGTTTERVTFDIKVVSKRDHPYSVRKQD